MSPLLLAAALVNPTGQLMVTLGLFFFKLFADKVPETAENSRDLSTGEKGFEYEFLLSWNYPRVCEAGELLHTP